MTIDNKYMKIALRLARKAQGLTHPNPAVGAVIVKGKKIVGKGYHKKCGLPHAEINALRQAGKLARGATMYVTLEPCDHYGRTSPCTEAIIKSGIRDVIIAMKDPNPITNGRGIRKLNKNGIGTKVGVLKEEAVRINRPFIKSVTEKVPYVTVKVAESIDGKIAAKTGDSKWISGEDSRRYVHELRGRVDAVMVGANTAVMDDPLLLSRIKNARQPIRIVVDSQLRMPLSARLFSTINKSPVIVATGKGVSLRRAALYEAKGAKVIFISVKNGMLDLRELLKALLEMGIIEVLVEGGGELVASLVERRLVDRFLFFIAPKIIGGRDAVTAVEGSGIDSIKEAVALKNVSIKKFKKDILIEAEV